MFYTYINYLNFLIHLNMSISNFIYNKKNNIFILALCIGHFLIGSHFLLMRYNNKIYKDIYLSLGIIGHSCISIFAFNQLLNDFNIINSSFMISQICMILFYLGILLNFFHSNVIFTYIYAFVFLILINYYINRGLHLKNHLKYPNLLCSFIYLNMIYYIFFVYKL
jgi:hypothetical protein